LLIEFNIKHENISENKRLMKLVDEKVFSGKWEVENVYIKVSISHISIDENGTFEGEIMNVLELPIKELILCLP
jgi:hypothetical protein